MEKTVQEFPNGKDIIEVRNREVQRLRNAINEDSEQAITDAKYGFIAGALRETYVDKQEDTARTTRVIDSIVTHRVWGYPIFFLFLYLMFVGTFILGDYPMQGIEWLVGVLGKKTITPPTPPIMPSTNRSFSGPSDMLSFCPIS